MKSHARALALWWTYLHAFSLAWDALSIADVGGFLAGLRTGDGPQVPSIEPRESRFAESTISTRLRAVTSCYRFHEMNGVSLGGDLVRVVHGGRAACKPMLEHVARKKGRQRAVIRVSTARTAPAGADARADRRDLRRVRVARQGPGSRTAGSGTASCGRCSRRRACGSARRWGSSTGTGILAAATPVRRGGAP